MHQSVSTLSFSTFAGGVLADGVAVDVGAGVGVGSAGRHAYAKRRSASHLMRTIVCFAAMHGRMMDFPLSITHLLERAAQYHGRGVVVSVRPDKSRVRNTYREIAE